MGQALAEAGVREVLGPVLSQRRRWRRAEAKLGAFKRTWTARAGAQMNKAPWDFFRQ